MKRAFRHVVLFPMILLLGTMTGEWSRYRQSNSSSCEACVAAAAIVDEVHQQEREESDTPAISTTRMGHHRRWYPSCCALICRGQRTGTLPEEEEDDNERNGVRRKNIRRRSRGRQGTNVTDTIMDNESQHGADSENENNGRCVVDCSSCNGDHQFSNNNNNNNNITVIFEHVQRQNLVLSHENTINDLGIRFNKFDFITSKPPGWTGLTANNYPIQGNKANVLKQDTTAVSVVTEDDYQFIHDCHRTAHEYIMASGGYPTMPNRDPSHAYWAEFEEVVDWQLARRRNVNPNFLFRLPDLWQGKTISQVAEAVHNEYPGSLQADFTEWLLSSSQPNVEIDPTLFPFRSQKDFLGKVVRSSFLNSWAVAEVGPITFYAKWAVGRPRPEEITWMISRDELTASDHGVPQDVVQKIKDMKLTSPESFTHYPEGSPQHPAWPAMHSAGSTSSFWLRIIFNLSEEQYCQALLTDYAVAMARTVAGVHYRMDNICGLNMGQEIIAERLADFLAEKYGSSRSAVQAKIDKERFDWEKFDPETCARW